MNIMASPAIVFIHLGKEPPPCLMTVMKQARFLNNDSPIYLIGDKICENGYETFFADEKISFIPLGTFPESDEHKQFYHINKIDKSLTNGLWYYATERFFVLYDFIKAYSLENVFHLENDSMLYVDLNTLLPLFTHIHVAAPFQSLAACIPCFVFIKNANSLEPLIHHGLHTIEVFQGTTSHLRTNDMAILADYYKVFGDEALTPLPTLMPEYQKFHPKRKSRVREDNTTPLSFLSLHANMFPGYLFDAAGLAIYINGNDPRYAPHAGPKTVHSRLLFYPHFFSITWEKDEKGRKFPYLYCKGSCYQIVNLHFHSKKVEEYTSYDSSLNICCDKSLGKRTPTSLLYCN